MSRDGIQSRLTSRILTGLPSDLPPNEFAPYITILRDLCHSFVSSVDDPPSLSATISRLTDSFVPKVNLPADLFLETGVLSSLLTLLTRDNSFPIPLCKLLGRILYYADNLPIPTDFLTHFTDFLFSHPSSIDPIHIALLTNLLAEHPSLRAHLSTDIPRLIFSLTQPDRPPTVADLKFLRLLVGHSPLHDFLPAFLALIPAVFPAPALLSLHLQILIDMISVDRPFVVEQLLSSDAFVALLPGLTGYDGEVLEALLTLIAAAVEIRPEIGAVLDVDALVMRGSAETGVRAGVLRVLLAIGGRGVAGCFGWFGDSDFETISLLICLMVEGIEEVPSDAIVGVMPIVMEHVEVEEEKAVELIVGMMMMCRRGGREKEFWEVFGSVGGEESLAVCEGSENQRVVEMAAVLLEGRQPFI